MFDFLDYFLSFGKIKILRDRPLFFIGGGGGGGVTFFVKKLFASCSWLKNCLLEGYELKKLSAKQKKIFWNTLIF